MPTNPQSCLSQTFTWFALSKWRMPLKLVSRMGLPALSFRVQVWGPCLRERQSTGHCLENQILPHRASLRQNRNWKAAFQICSWKAVFVSWLSFSVFKAEESHPLGCGPAWGHVRLFSIRLAPSSFLYDEEEVESWQGAEHPSPPWSRWSSAAKISFLSKLGQTVKRGKSSDLYHYRVHHFNDQRDIKKVN